MIPTIAHAVSRRGSRLRRASRAGLLLLVAALFLIGAGIAGCRSIFARPPFDPDAVARAEAAMWKGYYDGNRVRVALSLMELLRVQFGMTLSEARAVAQPLARAALAFKPARDRYAERVLPDLTEAYRRIARFSGAAFDPEAAARAELAWWVARRTPETKSPDQVGARIAALYAVLNGAPHPAFERAGRLRAEAAQLRYSGRANPDWPRIETLLRDSYREAAAGLSTWPGRADSAH